MSWRKLASVWATASALVLLLIIAAGISFIFFVSMAALTEVNAGPTSSPSFEQAGVELAPCFATPDDGVTVFNTADSSAVCARGHAVGQGGADTLGSFHARGAHNRNAVVEHRCL